MKLRIASLAFQFLNSSHFTMFTSLLDLQLGSTHSDLSTVFFIVLALFWKIGSVCLPHRLAFCHKAPLAGHTENPCLFSYMVPLRGVGNCHMCHRKSRRSSEHLPSVVGHYLHGEKSLSTFSLCIQHFIMQIFQFLILVQLNLSRCSSVASRF